MTIHGNPVNDSQQLDWAMFNTHFAAEAASDLLRSLEAQHCDDMELLTTKVWTIFGKAYAAGRLNPVEIVPLSP